jgi:hypothetical protein
MNIPDIFMPWKDYFMVNLYKRNNDSVFLFNLV